MDKIANKKCFFDYCNKILRTNYTENDYITNNPNDSPEMVINIYWVTKAVRKVYNDIHQPKAGCRCLLSTKFDLPEIYGLIVADVAFVRTVVDYLANLNKVCDLNCECPCSYTTTPTDECQHCGTCTTVACKHCYVLQMRFCSNCSKTDACTHCWTACVGYYLNCRYCGDGTVCEKQYVGNCASTTVGGYANCLGEQPLLTCYRECDSTCGNCTMIQP